MNRKKATPWTALLLALVLVLGLAACGQKTVTLKILDTEYAIEDYAIAIAKENADLLDKVNAALATITGNGTAQRIVDKYISGADHDMTFQANAEGKPELHMATNAQFPPYEYYEDNAIVGIDAEMAAAIADELDMKLVIDDMEFDAIITAVQTGKADMGMAGLTVTDERLQNVNFSDSYATGIQVVIIKADSPAVQSLDDLSTGVLIGTQEGTTGYIYCSDSVENGGYGEEHVMAYETGAVAIQALLAGKVDCVVIDNQPAQEYVKANPGLEILDTEFAVEDYAIAVKKGNSQLLDKVNKALSELIADGSVQKVVDKYITAD